MLANFSYSSNNTQAPDAMFDELALSEALQRPKVLAICFLLLVLILSSVLGNILVNFTIFMTRRLQFAAYYLVASLAVSDFGVGVFIIPISLAYNVTYEMKGKWVFGETACDVWTLANFWFCCASIFNLCAVTWDRYIAVTSPLRYSMRMRTSHVIKLILAAWTISLALSIVVSYRLKKSQTRILCEIQGLPLSFVLYNFIIAYSIPIIAIIFVNAKLWIITTRQMNKIQVQVLSIAPISPAPTVESRQPAQGRRQTSLMSTVKTFRTFLILIGSFVCCTTTFFAAFLVDALVKLPGFVMYLAVIINYINSATNPWIYGIWNKDFRECAVLACRKCFRRLRNVSLQS